MSLDRWLSIAADVCSIAAFVAVFFFGRSMMRHHTDNKRHVDGGDE